ncbi:GNAT domain containing protein [Aphelenchoides avenae]|nr:GNAT domain containing protein [Aphelenchus avenae]
MAAKPPKDGQAVIDDTISILKRCIRLADNATDCNASDNAVNKLRTGLNGLSISDGQSHTGVNGDYEPSETTSRNQTLKGSELEVIGSAVQHVKTHEPSTGISSLPTPQEPLTLAADDTSPVVIETYRDETQMPDIMEAITKELSEPYSIYTYRYFIHNWPELCLLARDTATNEQVGVIVCKLDKDRHGTNRGYIAMLAVEERVRRMGIGSRLVRTAIECMKSRGCDEVVLETEVTNQKALNLYNKLGFIREKRLLRYYLNGVDAFRLKLFFTSRSLRRFSPTPSEHGGECPA